MLGILKIEATRARSRVICVHLEVSVSPDSCDNAVVAFCYPTLIQFPSMQSAQRRSQDFCLGGTRPMPPGTFSVISSLRPSTQMSMSTDCVGTQ